MPQDDFLDALAALFLGVLGLAILAAIFGPPHCPKCGKQIQQGTRICPHCGAILQW